MSTESRENLPYGVVKRTVDREGSIHYWDGKGQLHNPDGPALLSPDKATYWLMTGRHPRELLDDPWFGARYWYLHARLHRTDGPAVERGDGTVGYWVNGVQLTEKEFHQRYPASRRNVTTDDQP